MLTKSIERFGQFFGYGRAPVGPPPGASGGRPPAQPRWDVPLIRSGSAPAADNK